MIAKLIQQILFILFLASSAISLSTCSPYHFAIDRCNNQSTSLILSNKNAGNLTLGSCSFNIDASGGILYASKALFDFLAARRKQKQYVQTYHRWNKEQFHEEALKKIAALCVYNNQELFLTADMHTLLLAEHHLYQFAGFRDLIRTFPEYESYIQELHKKASADDHVGNRWWKDFPGFEKKDFINLLKEMHLQVADAQRIRQNHKQQQIHAEQIRMQQKRNEHRQNVQSHAAYFHQYAKEHELFMESHELNDTQVERHRARVDAMNASEQDKYRLKIRPYSLSADAERFMRDCSIDIHSLLTCEGSFIQQQIHAEMITVLDQTAALRYTHIQNQSLALLTDTIGHMAYATIASNSTGQMQDAILLANGTWAFLEYGKAIARGIAQGTSLAIKRIIENPAHTIACAVASEYVLAYHVAAVLCNVFDIGITYAADPTKGRNKWQEYTAPLHQLIDAITDKELTMQQKIQGGARIASYLVVQSAALGSINRLCKGAQKAAVEFVKNNPLATPEQFAATPDGLMYKMAQDIGHAKPKGKFNAWSGGNGTVLRAHNMKQFFNEFEFGKMLKNCSIRTNMRYKGETIYRLEKTINEDLQKGYRFYLDSLHCDHLEVFDKKARIKAVFNLDGIKNIDKTNMAKKDMRELFKG